MKYLKNLTFYELSLRWVVLFCLLIFSGLAVGQTRTHDVGDYKYRVEANDYINTNEVDPTGEWPQDHFRYGTIVFYHCGCTVGKWIDAQGVEHTKENFF